MKSCWQCWPKFCKCPPSDSEIDEIRGYLYIAEQKLLKARIFASEFLELHDRPDDELSGCGQIEIELVRRAREIISFTDE